MTCRSTVPDPGAPSLANARLAARCLPALKSGMVIQFAAGGAFVPFVTLLFRDRGLDFRQISLIYFASSATLLVFPFVWGMLADRFVPLHRLFTIINLGAFLALVFLAGQHQFWGLLIGYTCFFACYNPAIALINALCFHHLSDPREQFGAVRAWGSIGWILPFIPISIYLSFGSHTHFDVGIYLSIALCAGMAGFSFWLPDTPSRAQRQARFKEGQHSLETAPQPTSSRGMTHLPGPALHPEPVGYGQAIGRLLHDPNYLVLLIATFLMSGSYSLLTYYSPALLIDLGVPRPWIGPVQGLGAAFEILLFPWQVRLARHWNYAAMILLGCMALFLRHLLFALFSNPWFLSGTYLLAGVVIVFFNMGVSVLVNAMATLEVRATAQTLLLFFGQGMGPLFANGFISLMRTRFHGELRAIFLFAAVLAGVATSVIALRQRRLNQAGHLRATDVPASFPRKLLSKR